MSSRHGDSDGTVRVRLADDREVVLRLGPQERQDYYQGARRARDVERTERAALAERVASEPGPIGPYRNTEKNVWAYRQGASLYTGVREAIEAGADDTETALEKAIEADPELRDAGSDALQAYARLPVVEDTLRRYHSDFDGKKRNERIKLLMLGAEHFDRAWWALDAFEEFVQAARPQGRARKKADDPQQNIRAAELRDALGLTYPEIGEFLGVPRSDYDERRYAHKPAEEMAGRGRKLLIENLGKEGYSEHIETISPGLGRWYALGPRGRTLQRMVEMTGRTPEEAEGMRPSFGRIVDERVSEDDGPPA